jgi:hypothetical protein
MTYVCAITIRVHRIDQLLDSQEVHSVPGGHRCGQDRSLAHVCDSMQLTGWEELKRPIPRSRL